jgi:hypothetical protein
MRFDANMTPHANLVYDHLVNQQFYQLAAQCRLGYDAQAPGAGGGLAPDGQRFDVYGLCRSCAAPGIS